MNLDLNNPIAWSEQFAIGIPLIDSQHQRLVEMAENLRITIIGEAHVNKTAVTKVLKGLISYCGDHFDCEQMLMTSVKFPMASNGHLALHRKFTDQTLKWFEEYQAGKLDPMLVLEALVQWLLDHILTKDIKIAQHCHAKLIDCNQFVTVADVIPTQQPVQCNIPVEGGMTAFMAPMFALWIWLAAQYVAPSTIVIPCLVMAACAILGVGMILYVRRTLHLQMQGLHLANARQLADNMLAGEIAQRVSVMDLENIESVFRGESSPLVIALQEIVEHLRLYLPYIPETILAIVRAGGAEDDDNNSEQALSAVQSDPHSPLSPATGASPTKPLLSVAAAPIAGCASMQSAAPLLDAYGVPLVTSPRTEGSAAEQYIIAVESGVSFTSQGGKPRPAVSKLAEPAMLNVPNVMSGKNGEAMSARSGAKEIGGGGSRMLQRRDSQYSKMSKVSAVSKGHGATRAKNLLSTWVSKKTISVMVTDITGFNHLAFSLRNDELLKMHTQYVVLTEAVSKATKGNLNSLVGDRVLISWNATTGVGNYAQQACKAALTLRDGLAKEKTFHGLKCKIAISTGTALVGNVGSKSHLSFALFGPVSVIASALCKLNAMMDTDILICANTYRNANSFYIAKIVTQFDLLCSSPGLDADDGIVEDLDGGEASALGSRDFLKSGNIPKGRDPVEAFRVGDVPSIPPPHPPSAPTESRPRPDTLFFSKSFATMSELRRMYALELIKAIGNQAEDEWMYQLQNAKNPFEAYNAAVLDLFYGNFEKGQEALKEYVHTRPDDRIAAELYDFSKNDSKGPSFTWVYGWTHP